MHITVICTQSYKQQTTTINNKTTSLNFTKNQQNKPRDREWEHQWSDQHFSTLQDLKRLDDHRRPDGGWSQDLFHGKKNPHTFIGKKHPSEGSCIQAQGRQRFHTEMQTSAEQQWTYEAKINLHHNHNKKKSAQEAWTGNNVHHTTLAVKQCDAQTHRFL